MPGSYNSASLSEASTGQKYKPSLVGHEHHGSPENSEDINMNISTSMDSPPLGIFHHGAPLTSLGVQISEQLNKYLIYKA